MLRTYNGFMIEGDYNPRRYWNYYVYNKKGQRPYEVGKISVKGVIKPFYFPVMFERLRDARRWIREGCGTSHPHAEIRWATHSGLVLNEEERNRDGEKEDARRL